MGKRIVVAALYIRNSDSSKMDTEVREHLVFKEATL